MQALVHNKLISILVVAYMINFLFMPGNQLVLPSYFVWQSISSKHYQSTRFFFFLICFEVFQQVLQVQVTLRRHCMWMNFNYALVLPYYQRGEQQ